MPIPAAYRPSYTILSPVRVELDGWSAGSPPDVDTQGTQWHLTQLIGWQDAPNPRTSFSPRPGEHGAFDGPAFLESRVVTITGCAIATSWTAASQARDIIASVCGDPSLGLSTLIVYATGNPTMQALVRRSAETRTESLGDGILVAFSIILTAPDPRRYSTTLTTQFIGLPQPPTGGLAFPLVFPLDFGGSLAGGEMSLTNAGTMATWPTWQILGPLTGPVITNVTTGEQLSFDPAFVVPAGQTLTINTDAKTVVLTGINRRDTLFAANWFRLLPGTTAIRFTSASGSDPAARLTVSYREAYS